MKTRDVFAIVAGVLAIALMAWAFGSGRGEDPSEQESSSPAATSPTVSDGGGASDAGGASDGGGTARETAGTDPGASPATDDDRTASAERADAAARVWVDHSLTTAEWQEQMRPQVQESAWAHLALPDPQRVGPREVTGEPVAVRVDHSSADYDVPTDAGMLRVVVVNGGEGQWLVSSIAKDV